MPDIQFKVISALQAVLNSLAIVGIMYAYYEKDSVSHPNPYNDGGLSVPAIMLMMALPLMLGKIAKSVYGITKDKEENDTMTMMRHTGSSLALLGASIVLGLLFTDKSLKGDNRDEKIRLAWVYWSLHAADRLLDVFLDHLTGDKSMGGQLFWPFASPGRVTDYPEVEEGKNKQRLYRAAAVMVMLGMNLFGIIITRSDNEGHVGAGDNENLNIVAMVAVCVHLVLAFLVVLAAHYQNNPMTNYEIFAINENPLVRSAVAGFVIVAIGMDFGYIWGANEEATWFMVSVAASLLADAVGRDVA